MKEDHNRMAKRGRKRKVVDDMPPEGTPVEMAQVQIPIMKCPRCGSAKPGQWEMIRANNSGEYFWCRSCGSKVVRSHGVLFVIG